ncbi:MAG: hypothetical protein M3540_01015, partial [Actinomycetota bacterium]|nr:hypothetical protein [Actinomycetota bacterium]
MRAIWIDEGSDPDYPRLTKHGITDLYFSPRVDQGHPKDTVDAARAQGFTVGLYRALSWDDTLSGKDWAKLLSGDVARFVGGDGKGIGVQLGVQANVETHDMAWCAEFLRWWRLYRPLRETSWTMEGFQGGLLKDIRLQILASRVDLVPQCYGGAMEPWDTAGTVKD